MTNKVDVAIQSFKKPESLIYTLFSLKKYCGEYIDTVYINDDCSYDGSVEKYKDKNLQERLYPIKIKVRENVKPSKYTNTIMTKKLFKKKSLLNKVQLLGNGIINRLKWHKEDDDIRYQWALNNTDKKYLFIIHDDIKFFDNVVQLYLDTIKEKNFAIVGDLGGARQCPYGKCGEEGKCSPAKILNKEYPQKNWPLTGKPKTFIHAILGRKKRNCRINEWCCMLDVNVAKQLKEKYGVCFGNYEGGGDVGTYWFEKIIKLGYGFTDPLPDFEERKKWYLHWWQGHEGHQVWVDYYGEGKSKYQKERISNCLQEEFNYKI